MSRSSSQDPCDIYEDALAELLLDDAEVGDKTAASAEVEAARRHLESCQACRDELGSLRRVWSDLGELRQEDAPSLQMRTRFDAMLTAYEAGLAARRPSLYARLAAWVESWWPRQPMLQVALTAAALVLGVLIGQAPSGVPGGDLAGLEAEVASLRRTMSLTLLTQASAVERLQGAQLSRRLAANPASSADPQTEELLDALFRVLADDENDNVRLAAVEALARWADRPSVADGLRHALPQQESPLLQLALAELLAEINGPATDELFRDLLRRENLDASVRGYLQEHLGPRV